MNDVTKRARSSAATRTGNRPRRHGRERARGRLKPDIRSADVQRALLNAKSVAYAPEGATGTILRRFSISSASPSR
jgi:hypothetical protein